MPSDVRVERHGNVAFVRIDRGVAANAVGPRTMQQLCTALDTVIADASVRAIVLGHGGRHFVAGADFAFLEELKTASVSDARNDIYRWFQGAAKRLYHCGKPTVAAIGGAAITVGCELAIACDFRIVTARSSFRESWIRLGLIPPLGGLKKLPALVGYRVASEMILRAREIKGEEAVAIGLANELVAEGELEAYAVSLAQELADLAPLAYETAKLGLHRGLESSFDEGWTSNVLAQSMLIGSSDFREAVDATLEKRPPVFWGR